MTMSNDAEASLLDLLFLNIDFANVGDAAGLQNSAVAGSFYVALHTADPGEAGKQNASEVSYTGYTRVAVPRTAPGFTRSGNQISNTSLVQFVQSAGGGSPIATHWSIGLELSGATVYLVTGALTASLTIGTGVQPQFAPGALTATAD